MKTKDPKFNKFRNNQIGDITDFRIGCYYFIEEKSNNEEILEIMRITELVEDENEWGAKTIYDFTDSTLESEWNHDGGIFDVFDIYQVDMNDYPELLL